MDLLTLTCFGTAGLLLLVALAERISASRGA